MPGKQIKLYMPHGVPQITRGEAGDEMHHTAERDGSFYVNEVEVEDFLAMGCSLEPQGPPEVVNHVE